MTPPTRLLTLTPPCFATAPCPQNDGEEFGTKKKTHQDGGRFKARSVAFKFKPTAMVPHCRNTALTSNTSYGSLPAPEMINSMKEEAFRSFSSDFAPSTWRFIAAWTLHGTFTRAEGERLKTFFFNETSRLKLHSYYKRVTTRWSPVFSNFPFKYRPGLEHLLQCNTAYCKTWSGLDWIGFVKRGLDL